MADSTVDRRDFPALNGLIISKMLGFGLTTSSMMFVAGALLPALSCLLAESLLVSPCPAFVSFSGSSLFLSANAHRRVDLSWLLHLRTVALKGGGLSGRWEEQDNVDGEGSENEQDVFGRSTIINITAPNDAEWGAWSLLLKEFKFITEKCLVLLNPPG